MNDKLIEYKEKSSFVSHYEEPQQIEQKEESSNLPSKENFEAYERVRQSGLTNMFDTRVVSELSGLERNEILAVMNNYDALMKKYPDVRG